MSTNATQDKSDSKGLPLGIPLIGLLIAFVAALFIGARICPVLSTIVAPPDPRLPSGAIQQLDHLQKGNGLDEWVYGTKLSGCDVALFYEAWLKDCTYDPDEHCSPGGTEQRKVAPRSSCYHVVTCTGDQSIGVMHLAWTAYVATGYLGDNPTVFRLVREVGN
jgi:hypothetical protein